MLTRLRTPISTACNARWGGDPKTATSAQTFPPITKDVFRMNFETLYLKFLCLSSFSSWKIDNKKNLRIRPKHVFVFELSSETKFTLFHVKTIIRYKSWTDIISPVIFSAKNVI